MSQGSANNITKAVVNETPESYLPGSSQPLSLTNDGQLRVRSQQDDFNKIWQGTFASPWGMDSPSGAEVNYPSIGAL